MSDTIIKDAQKDLDLSPVELAKQIGVSDGTLRNWSSSNKVPTWAINSIKMLKELKNLREEKKNFDENIEISEEVKKSQEIGETVKNLFKLLNHGCVSNPHA